MNRTALIQLLVAEVLIASVGVFVHESGQDPITAVFFRCVFGAAFLCAWGAFTGEMRGLLRDRKVLIGAAISGVALVLNWVGLFAGMARSSIGVATMVFHVYPFAMLAFAALVYREKTRVADIGWAALAIAGVALTTDPVRVWHDADATYLLGIGLTLGAAVLSGIAMMMSRRISKERPLGIVAIQCIVGIVMLAPFANFASVASFGPHWLWLAGLGLIHSGVCYVLFYRSYPHLSVATIAILAFVYPAIALVFDYALYGKALGTMQFAGLALIVVASLGVNLKWTLSFGRRKVTAAPMASPSA
jgi:drug/metabolite transporter (DMT)-like permease